MFLGPPLPPSVVINGEHLVNDTFTVSLNLSQPFTWPGFPITNYTATLISTSGSRRIHNTSIIRSNGVETLMQQYQFTTEGNSCYELLFFVTANNSIGESQPTHAAFGHPISGNFAQ